VFTYPNYTPAQCAWLQSLKPKFLIYGREISPSTGTPHLQGYIEFDSQKTLTAVKSLLKGNPHLEEARGNAEQNIAYCSKEDPEPYRWGEPGAQGRRNDIAGFVDAVKEGKTFLELLDSHPEECVKYHGAFDKIRFAAEAPRSWKMEVLWYYGPTGTGKSWSAMNLAGEDVYRKAPGKWWDGYEGQHTVVLDEFRGDWFPFYHLLLLLDEYPLTVEVKGGSRKFNSHRIIITCPTRWDELFRGQTEEKLNQLERRITETRFFPHRYHAPPAREEVVHQYHEEAGLGEDRAHDEAIINWAVDGAHLDVQRGLGQHVIEDDYNVPNGDDMDFNMDLFDDLDDLTM